MIRKKSCSFSITYVQKYWFFMDIRISYNGHNMHQETFFFDNLFSKIGKKDFG